MKCPNKSKLYACLNTKGYEEKKKVNMGINSACPKYAYMLIIISDKSVNVNDTIVISAYVIKLYK